MKAPFIAAAKAIRALMTMTAREMRSLFSLCMLSGIVILNMMNIMYLYLAHHAVEQGETYAAWFDLLTEQTRFNSGLSAFFALIIGYIVSGAQSLRAKVAGAEIGINEEAKHEIEEEWSHRPPMPPPNEEH